MVGGNCHALYQYVFAVDNFNLQLRCYYSRFLKVSYQVVQFKSTQLQLRYMQGTEVQNGIEGCYRDTSVYWSFTTSICFLRLYEGTSPSCDILAWDTNMTLDSGCKGLWSWSDKSFGREEKYTYTSGVQSMVPRPRHCDMLIYVSMKRWEEGSYAPLGSPCW